MLNNNLVLSCLFTPLLIFSFPRIHFDNRYDTMLELFNRNYQLEKLRNPSAQSISGITKAKQL